MSPSPLNAVEPKEPDASCSESEAEPDPAPPAIKSESAESPAPAPAPTTVTTATTTANTTTSAPTSSGTATGAVRPDEYEAGRVICEACGTGVSFRDDDSGGFTLKQWEAHRLTCPAAPQRPPGQLSTSFTPGPSLSQLFSPTSTSASASASGPMTTSAAGPQPPKRRRAKRTEEERIAYLAADPYVGKYEAYRVLCASCDKWIRLRPNSTYCSIPWDAHRKSCLAKKITTKNPYALSERNTLFAKDPDVRKFDPERLLCNICDRWLTLPPDDHLGAVQKWLSHRAACGRGTGMSSSEPMGNGMSMGLGMHMGAAMGMGMGLGAEGGMNMEVMRRDYARHHQKSREDVEHGQGPAVPSSLSPSPRPGTGSTQSPGPASTSANAAGDNGAAGPSSNLKSTGSPAPSGLNPTTNPNGSPNTPYLLTPQTYAPAHESRRRNAEQRAATLRADRLIGRVEPNRVFCSLCAKWVQLRQDSSYCAYPWVQHRGKCLRRSERRNAKAAELAHLKNSPPTTRGNERDRERDHANHGQSHSHNLNPNRESISSRHYDLTDEHAYAEHHHSHRDQAPPHNGSSSRRSGGHASHLYAGQASTSSSASIGLGHPSRSQHPQRVPHHAQQRAYPPHHSQQLQRGNGNGYASHHGQRNAYAQGRMDADEVMSDASLSASDDEDGRGREDIAGENLEAEDLVDGGDDADEVENDDDDDIGKARARKRPRSSGVDARGSQIESESEAEGHASSSISQSHREQGPPSRSRPPPDERRHRTRHAGAGALASHGAPNGNATRYSNGNSNTNGSTQHRTNATSNAALRPRLPLPSRMAHAVSTSSSTSNPYRRTSLSGARRPPNADVSMGGDDADADGEPDADGDVDGDADGDEDEGGESEAMWREEMEASRGGTHAYAQGQRGQGMARGVPRRAYPVGLADLDSPAGRKQFIQTSLTHLFRTTFEPTDELSVSALLAFLNAAMPADKHEDFDTTEVARAVAALAERGRVRFEGDIVRVVD